MHPIEFLFYCFIFVFIMLLIRWVGNLPTKYRFEQLKIQLKNQHLKVEELETDYNDRKSNVGFFKKLSVDNSELIKEKDNLRKIESEYHRHAIKFDPIEAEKEKERQISAQKFDERLYTAVDVGLKAKGIFDFMSKIIK